VSEGERVRAFLAVPPDGGWTESARAFLARTRPGLPDASWTRPESWHLTLKFLGEVSRDWLSRFANAVGPVVIRLPAPVLTTRGAVIFPPRGPARVLGMGFTENAGSHALADLAREAEDLAREMGMEPERRSFHPHATFARLRHPWPADAVARFREEAGSWAFPIWPVRSCVLYESRLSPGGAVHMPVGQWSLAAAQGMSA
jgi:2'-5' RNA ligase